MMKQKRYNLDNLDNKNCLYNLILGEKSSGKSYQVKHKKAIEYFIKHHKRFILTRRFDEDLSSEWIEQYFSDVDIEKISDGKAHCVVKYRNSIYLAKIDSEYRKKKVEKIGYAIPLSLEQRFSSASFLDVDNIIFEEFMSRTIYLKDEPNKLMTFYSTVDRKRGTTRLWLVGNTVSRICPYLEAWGIDETVKSMKQGDIEVINFKNGDTNISLGIEYCESSGGKSLAIGTAKTMIDSGAWQVDNQPKLPKSYNEYKKVFTIGFQYKNFKFLGEYLLDKEENTSFWFVKPYCKDFDKKTIVFSDCINTSKLWQTDIYNPNFPIAFTNIDKIKKILYSFKENNIFYSSDLCGTDFKQAINFMIRR